MRVLALDVGDRRVGLAVSDPTGLLASPFGVVARGPSGAQAAKVRQFIRELRAVTDIPIVTVDERLSTVQARRLLADIGSGRRGIRDRGRIDASAAAVILQAYLDSQR